LVENRDDERALYLLVNALRKRLLDLTNSDSGTGLALFSYPVGRGDTSNSSSGNEDMIIEFELPTVFPAFQLSMSCQALAVSGHSTIRARMGGTWNVPTDGNIIATMTCSTPAFSRTETSSAVTGNTGTLLKLTHQSSIPGVKVTFAGGFVIGN
jgi:hypothetical protein